MNLKKKSYELGLNKVWAFATEPIVEATMGVVPAGTNYFTRLRYIFKKSATLLFWMKLCMK